MGLCHSASVSGVEKGCKSEPAKSRPNQANEND